VSFTKFTSLLRNNITPIFKDIGNNNEDKSILKRIEKMFLQRCSVVVTFAFVNSIELHKLPLKMLLRCVKNAVSEIIIMYFMFLYLDLPSVGFNFIITFLHVLYLKVISGKRLGLRKRRPAR
jgi:hypothetical protein